MKLRGMTGLEISHIIRELRRVEGSFIKKIYNIGESSFSLSFHPEVDGRREIFIDLRGFLFLTKLKWTKPQTPSPFVMVLRKHLENARIERVSQLGLERIVSFEFPRGMKLIVELFGGGNLILLSGDEIVAAQRRAEYRDRKIRAGEIYKLPPSLWQETPSLSREDVIRVLGRISPDEKVWKALIGFGLGPPYLNEVLLKLGIDAERKLSDLDLDALANEISELMSKGAEPTLYLDGEEIVEYSAFPLSHLEYERVSRDLLSDAVEDYYRSKGISVEDERISSLRREIERQISLKGEYERSYAQMKRIGDIIFSNIHEVEDALAQARSGGEHILIKRVDRESGKVIISLEGEEIELDIRKSASENASEYYDRAKKSREKALRIDKAVSTIMERLRQIESSLEERRLELSPKPRKKVRWYERFRWFYTSSGNLVICGRDAQTNSEIVSKYMDDDDLFFHVDMPGGAVVVLKAEGEIDQRSIEQAAIAAASFSRAWKEGLSYADVYYVKGEQVSKHAPPGMYLPKGSFYITGKRNYLRAKLELSVGIQETPDGMKLTAAPPDAPFICSVRIKPGSMSKEEAAIKIKNKLIELLSNVKIGEGAEVPADELTIDNIVRSMPPGKVRVEE
jgi:predicted ribosome quality control (RQC) complex YloA/Tae2 family protein